MPKPTSLFVSHGAPDLIIADTKATRFLADHGATMERPSAIISVSAHFETEIPAIVADPAPTMIYDFRGFADELYQITYPAPGAPDLANQAADLLRSANIDHEVLTKRGYDHGTWVPLKLLWPQADIPVLQISVQPTRDAKWHFNLGRALRPLTDDGALMVASGSFTHNLEELFHAGLPARDADVPDWVSQFADWFHTHLAAGNTEPLLAWLGKAPHARKNHPTPEHLLPIFVAMGAASTGSKVHAERIHKSAEFGVLAMDAYAFSAAP